MTQYAKIKIGAMVYCDHSFPHWGVDIGLGEELRPFEITRLDTSHSRYDLRAWGYGLSTAIHGEGAYGNGSLFVSAEDIEILTAINVTEVYRPALPQVKTVKRTLTTAELITLLTVAEAKKYQQTQANITRLKAIELVNAENKLTLKGEAHIKILCNTKVKS